MKKELLREFLNLFWLRPENGILLSVRANEILKFKEFVSLNSIDVSCGDGTFSFITNGGRFSENSDIFQSVKLPKSYRKDNFDNFDYYDNYHMEILKKPDVSFTYGIDWKENLLKKAQVLNFYDKLFVHDNNERIPLENESFDYIYSNSTYWVEKFEEHIQDLIRISKSNGILVFEIKVDRIKEYTSYNYLPNMGSKFHEIIDAGRLSTWKGLKSLDYLIDFFKSLDDVIIEDIRPIYGEELALIWDIGMRPLFKPLYKMSSNIPNEIKNEVKKEWVNTFFDLFEYKIENYKANYNTAIEYLFVLRKK